jgi:hypothetical protein
MEIPPASSIKLLRTWANLGADITASRSRAAPDWSAVRRMIDAVRPIMEIEANRLKWLLEKSREKLKPLGEPFDLDLGLHRWLDAEREEAYSDWLEWVVRQAETPARVFRLFGLDCADKVTQSAQFEVQREYCIPHGHPDQQGRLDLVIWHGHQAIIAIEVKKGDAEGADTVKHGGYRRWLDGRLEPIRHGVFLAVSAEEEDYDGFPFLRWADVCIAMRLLAMELCKQDRMMAAAMVLAFAAAVEQNLLGFSAELVRSICKGKRVYFNTSVVDYSEDFLDEAGDSNGT